MTTVTMDISFKLQHLEQISEFSEALFPSHLQGGYRVICVPEGSWILCGEALKAMWVEKFCDKCAAVIMRLNQTMRLKILWNIQWHI